jgi:hypothetical protein
LVHIVAVLPDSSVIFVNAWKTMKVLVDSEKVKKKPVILKESVR